MRRAIVLIIASLFLLVGCSESEPEAATSSVSSQAVVIDVRTPAEFAEGHLEGALNLDSASPDTAAELETMDKDGEYLLYCRSGNRAGTIKTLMEDMGFTNVENLGSVQAASEATGLPIVTD
jgi:rhodanese-related sulfurtransferase